MGLRGDMRIETVAGPKQIGELARNCDEDPDFSIPLISWTGSKVFIVQARNFRCVGEEQIITVELDDGNKLYLSSSSELMLRLGDSKKPVALAEGDSLLPFYTKFDRNKHPCFRNPGKSELIKFVKLVAAWKLGRELEKGDFVTVIDKDKNNYHPNNLKITHNKSQATKSRSYGLIQIAEELNNLASETSEVEEPNNHRVLSTELGLTDSVYTATLGGAEVVAVAGVFVKLPCVEA
jgi:hypothetical protein